jgi:hypothetical protein
LIECPSGGMATKNEYTFSYTVKMAVCVENYLNNILYVYLVVAQFPQRVSIFVIIGIPISNMFGELTSEIYCSYKNS